jgi:hypothetical protein
MGLTPVGIHILKGKYLFSERSWRIPGNFIFLCVISEISKKIGDIFVVKLPVVHRDKARAVLQAPMEPAPDPL